MPNPTILRVHYAYPAQPCRLSPCLRTHWWQARCDKTGCDWHGIVANRKRDAKAALEKHGEKGCGGS